MLSKEFFPSLISGPMASGMQIAFAVSAFYCVVAAIVSWFRGAPIIARDTAVTETPTSSFDGPTRTGDAFRRKGKGRVSDNTLMRAADARQNRDREVR